MSVKGPENMSDTPAKKHLIECGPAQITVRVKDTVTGESIVLNPGKNYFTESDYDRLISDDMVRVYAQSRIIRLRGLDDSVDEVVLPPKPEAKTEAQGTETKTDTATSVPMGGFNLGRS